LHSKRSEGIVSKDRTHPYQSGPRKTWLKIKNPQAPGVARFKADERFSKSAHAWCLRTFELNTDFTEHCGKDTPQFPMLCANKIAPTNSYKNV
jgi:hypothetical protein